MKSSRELEKKSWRKVFAGLLIWLMCVRVLPVCASAPDVSTRARISTGQSRAVKPERVTAPKRLTAIELTKAQVRKLVFSNEPSDLEIFNARLFFEPLVPVGSKSSISENRELAQALSVFKSRKNSEDVSALDQFVKHHPDSRWTPALQSAIANERFDTGYYRDALHYWTAAWDATRSQTTAGAKSVADLAVSHLVLLEARLGLTNSLEKHVAQIGNRRLTGSVAQRVKDAKEGCLSGALRGGIWKAMMISAGK